MKLFSSFRNICGLFLLLSLPLLLPAQARINISGDAWIVIDNAAYLVIDNPAPNALQVGAGGGNIRSEDENDLIRWNIGASTGTYQVPWTTENNVKIPLTITLSSAGAGNGHFLLSTHPDNDAVNNWNNFDYRPSDVTNMGGSGIPNNSPNVIDRFWRIEQTGYSTPPQAVLTFGYDDAERLNAGNTIPAASLVAQRFSTVANAWLLPGLGVDNHPTLTVSGAAVASDFFKSWTLSHNLIPLPEESLDLQAVASDQNVMLDYSWDLPLRPSKAFVFRGSAPDQLEEILPLLTESALQKGQSLDPAPLPGTNYYQLLAQMPDGKVLHSEIQSLYFEAAANMQTYPNPGLGQSLQILFSEKVSGPVHLQIFSLEGKEIWSIHENLQGQNRLSLDGLSRLARGIYLLKVRTSSASFQEKLIRY